MHHHLAQTNRLVSEATLLEKVRVRRTRAPAVAAASVSTVCRLRKDGELLRNATRPTMKTILRLLPVSFLLLAMVSAQEALAGDCGSNRCNATFVAPYVPPAPATASASHGFAAVGGTRVADVNLSQEGRDRLAAGDKEEPLPKGWSTAADRAKLVVEPRPLDGWSQNPRKRLRLTRRSVAGPVTTVKVAIAASAKSKN